MAQIAKSLDRGREQDGLGDGRHLGRKAALAGLGPEGCEIRRKWRTGQHLALALFKQGDNRAEIFCQIARESRWHDLVTVRGKQGRGAVELIGPFASILIVGEQPADDAVDLKPADKDLTRDAVPVMDLFMS